MQQETNIRKKLTGLYQEVRDNRFRKRLMRHFEWPLFMLVIALSFFGVITIFAATATPVDSTDISMLEMIRLQPSYYARTQLIWIGLGLITMGMAVYLDYAVYGRLYNILYLFNILMLLVVLAIGIGRGGASMFYSVGEQRTFQPAEFGKIAMIIALAKVFANRKRPIRTVRELLLMSVYVGFPLVLIVLQPDVGTALVYIAVFAVLLFVSGTNYRLLIGIVCLLIIVLVPAWFIMTAQESFRMARIQVWLDPSYDPLGAGLQTTNARIAAASGGIWGKGLFSPGSFASLNYIPDDHTDFIFAIVLEAFGLVGAGLMALLFLLMILRMIVLARQAQDAFGSYLIVGVTAMLFFHIFENIAMVIGLMPVTGIPLPFISYGGSNYMTNMLGIGLVINVAMRSRARTRRPEIRDLQPERL